MNTVKELLTEEDFFSTVYKSAKMGADAIINLLPKVKNDGLRSQMTRQLDGYERYAASARRELERIGSAVKEENLLLRVSARMGMACHTMVDASAGHIAEMLIEGSNMNITDMTRLLNNYAGDREEAEDAIRLARDVIDFEGCNVEALKRYL